MPYVRRIRTRVEVFDYETYFTDSTPSTLHDATVLLFFARDVRRVFRDSFPILVH